MEIFVYPFKLFKSDRYCFAYLNEYYMEISMDQFGEALKVLHGYFHEPVLIKNVWYCFVYVNEHCMYMENFMDCFETIFFRVNWYYMEISMYQFNFTWIFSWIFLVWHYHIEIVNTADKFSEGHRLFNSLVDHERDICAAVCTSYHNIRVSFTTHNWKSRRYLTHFFTVKQQVDRKR